MTKRITYISGRNGHEKWYDRKTGFTKKTEPAWIAAPDTTYTYNESLELSLPDKRIPTIRTTFWADGILYCFLIIKELIWILHITGFILKESFIVMVKR